MLSETAIQAHEIMSKFIWPDGAYRFHSCNNKDRDALALLEKQGLLVYEGGWKATDAGMDYIYRYEDAKPDDGIFASGHLMGTPLQRWWG